MLAALVPFAGHQDRLLPIAAEGQMAFAAALSSVTLGEPVHFSGWVDMLSKGSKVNSMTGRGPVLLSLVHGAVKEFQLNNVGNDARVELLLSAVPSLHEVLRGPVPEDAAALDMRTLREQLAFRLKKLEDRTPKTPQPDLVVYAGRMVARFAMFGERVNDFSASQILQAA
jgi:hypothetical protein